MELQSDVFVRLEEKDAGNKVVFILKERKDTKPYFSGDGFTIAVFLEE